MNSSIIETINEDSLWTIYLMFGIQLAGVLTRCSSHPQGKSEVKCKSAGDL